MPSNAAVLSPSFYNKFKQLSSELGLNAEDLLAIIFSESGGNPQAFNQSSKAVGLIQFLPSTLKGLGWQGSVEEFKSVAAEEQLDYVKKFIDNIKSIGPILSPDHYYLGIFFPVALALPGVRQNDKNTVILEKDPAFVIDGGKRLSKKYYDIGKKIPVDFEIKAYNANSLFHNKSIEGVITLGDLGAAIKNSKSLPAYKEALQLLNSTTIGESVTPSNNGSQFRDLLNDSERGSLNTSNNSKFKDLLEDQAIASPSPATSSNSKSLFTGLANQKNMNIMKSSELKLLPTHSILIEVNSSDINSSIEFSRILCTALDEELLSKSFTHTDGASVEIECDIAGPARTCLTAVKEISDCTKNSFKNVTKKIGSVTIDTKIKLHKKSKYPAISLKSAENNYRKFLLKFI
jgi:hypothetical protein